MNTRFIIELTSQCNLRCAMCGHPTLRRRKEHMPFDFYAFLIDQIKAGGWRVRQLHLYGEPLCHPRFPEAVKYLADRDMEISFSLSTNVMLLDDNMTQRLLANGFVKVHRNTQVIRLCVDSMIPEVYRQLRIGGDLPRVVDQAQRFIKAMEPFRFRNIYIQWMRTRINKDETPYPFYQAFPGIPLRIQNAGRHQDKSRDLTIHPFESFGDRRPKCPMIMDDDFYIMASGLVTKCCLDADGLMPVGDAKSQPLSHIVKSPLVETYREHFRNGRFDKIPICAHCTGNECRGCDSNQKDQLCHLGVRDIRALPQSILLLDSGDPKQVVPLLYALKGKFPQACLEIYSSDIAAFKSASAPSAMPGFVTPIGIEQATACSRDLVVFPSECQAINLRSLANELNAKMKAGIDNQGNVETL